MPRSYATPPDLDDIAALGERALAEIPARLARHLGPLVIAVEDAADNETLEALGCESVWDLTGLYEGTPLDQRSPGDIAPMPDRIVLFREPILLEWIEEDEDLYRLVRNVVVHEIAHHFGFSDAEIEAIERDLDR